ncbi:plastocyanin/azurin family copper-binding protein [Fonticella tunisiensis]
MPQAEDGKYPVDNTDFKADYKGEYCYICQYPGHAQDGMYGKIIVQ